jgi:hypothetical protein
MSVAIVQACILLHRAEAARSNKPAAGSSKPAYRQTGHKHQTANKFQITSTKRQTSSKSQAPNIKQGPNIKFQIPNEEEEETDSKFQTKKRTC